MAKIKKVPLKTKDCETCKGVPKEVPFKIAREGGEFEGMRCDDCMKILNYKKI